MTVATKLMVGHMMRTVQLEIMMVMKNGLSCPGVTWRKARERPTRLPKRVEKTNTNTHINAASFSASQNTLFSIPPTLAATLYSSMP